MRNEPLDDSDGITQCEAATLRLKNAIEAKFENGLGEMHAVQERINLYASYANTFANRFSDHFKKVLNSLVETTLNDKSRASKKAAAKLPSHDNLEIALFKLRNLLLWLRDFDAKKLQNIQEVYTSSQSLLSLNSMLMESCILI